MRVKINKNLFFSLLVFIGFVISAVILVNTVNKIIDLKKQINIQYAKLDKLYKQGKLIKKIKLDFDKIKPEITLLDNALLREGDELVLITTLEKIALKYNLDQYISMKELPQNGIKDITKIPITVTLNGNFVDVIKYIKELEEQPFYINWQDINITSSVMVSGSKQKGRIAGSGVFGDETLKPGSVSVIISGNTYWVPKN